MFVDSFILEIEYRNRIGFNSYRKQCNNNKILNAVNFFSFSFASRKNKTMIQRIQSVYLIAVALCGFLMMMGNFAVFNDLSGQYFLNALGFDKVPDETNFTATFSMAISSFVLASIVFSLITIFLYKNRAMQIRLTQIIIALNIGLLISLYSYINDASNIIGSTDFDTQYKLTLALPTVSMVLSILALSGIKKDENLLKSLDRLR